MTDRKPRARSGGRRPRAKGGSSAQAGENRKASDSRGRIKARLLALEARYSTLESLVNRLVAEVIPSPERVVQRGPEWLTHEPNDSEESNA